MIRNWLRNFMIGRYGPDQLNMAMLIVSLVFYLLGGITRIGWLNLIGLFILIMTFIRMLSRNIAKRRAENDRFLRFWWPLRQKIKFQISKFRENKSYKFFKCPACHNVLRVPRGKGKIKITCPKCGERFSGKS